MHYFYTTNDGGQWAREELPAMTEDAIKTIIEGQPTFEEDGEDFIQLNGHRVSAVLLPDLGIRWDVYNQEWADKLFPDGSETYKDRAEEIDRWLRLTDEERAQEIKRIRGE